MEKRSVLFFDIDNCLYPKSKRIQHLMVERIDEYFRTHLGLSVEDADRLHTTYYTQYGLAIEGLVRHHKVDALAYNKEVDDALPLEDILSPDLELRALLEDLDTSIVKPWLFTNAYVNHGKRVVKLLGIDDLFEGITFSDYGAIAQGRKMLCKPTKEAYLKAMKDADVTDAKQCFFVDDSYINCKGAAAEGWTVAHLIDLADKEPEVSASQYQVRSLEELRDKFPQFFKSKINQGTG